jgi:hypothetical protein
MRLDGGERDGDCAAPTNPNARATAAVTTRARIVITRER